MLLQKLRELTWIISKNWIYYAAYNNTKYYLIASYLLESQQITESIKNTTKPDEVYKRTKSIKNKDN